MTRKAARCYRVVVVGAWSFSFFVCGTFGPSTPLFGCGAGPGNPCAAGVCEGFIGGFVIDGGSF